MTAEDDEDDPVTRTQPKTLFDVLHPFVGTVRNRLILLRLRLCGCGVAGLASARDEEYASSADNTIHVADIDADFKRTYIVAGNQQEADK